MANLIIFVENCIADAPMLIIKSIFVSLSLGMVAGAIILIRGGM